MGNDPLSVIKVAAVLAVALWFSGFCALYVGARKAKREFRGKGFLRPPQGTAWVRFLFMKQYEYFETPSIRFYFGASHMCMIGLLVVLGAAVVFIGSEVMLNGLDAFSLSGPGAPTLQQP